MARLRQPLSNEPTIFQPPSEGRATRSSPRKAIRSLRYTTSSDEEESILVPKASSRDLRYLSSQPANESFSARKIAPAPDALTPRKQRILRPVESNSRLLRKLSGQSLASPEKKQRDRRIRSGTTDVDVGNKSRLMYARTLAKSVVKKQASRANISVVGDEEYASFVATPSRKSEEKIVDILEDEEIEEAETTIICGDENDFPVQESNRQIEESSEDEDDDPVVEVRQRQRQRYARRIASDTEDDEEEDKAPHTTVEPEPLRSMRPPHRKGHSMISDWAQDVIELAHSPEPPGSFVVPPLPPPSRSRGESFASVRSQTSSSSALAILTYSPTPTKFRSPCKAPPISRPSTPPLAPPSPSKLVSPSKKKPVIPKAPGLRQSLDAFWNPEVVNDWNEMHSPVKPLVSPKKQKWREDVVKMMDSITLSDSGDSDTDFPSPTTSPKKKVTPQVIDLTSPTKKLASSQEPSVKELRAQRKEFAERKHAIAESFLLELDNTICAGKISSMSQQTGGIKLVWSKTLQTTAGRANWRREQLRLRTGSLPTDFRLEVRHHCSIELAEKVIDDEERLYNVLAHEFCHLTTFMISDVRNNPHGAEFKSWGKKVINAFAHKGVEVTTKHSYAIEYKYIWECVTCGYEFKRHSKSVDPAKHSCGKCKGRLVQTRPKPRTVAAKDGKEKSGYQVFVKENFGRVKREMVEKGEDTQMGKVMAVVAREYKAKQSGKDKDNGNENGKGKKQTIDEADLQRALASLEI